MPRKSSHLLLTIFFLTACGDKPSTDSTQANLAPTAACGERLSIVTSNVKNLPRPPLRDGIGTASFKITTTNSESQAYFDSGLNLLHAFWRFEAYRAFRHVTELDPDCAMAYWGIVMCMPGSQPEFLSERQNALKRALALREGVTPREQAHLDALQTLVSLGAAAFAEKMASQWQNDPSDVDAGAFAAYYLKEGYDAEGKPTANQQRAVQFIDQVLKRSPQNTAALHYGIHVFELGPEIDRALPLAAEIARLAPRASHMVHMPGHVAFFRGDYASAIDHFRAAYQVDQEYHQQEGIDYGENENFTHNLNFLALAYAEAGRLKEALLYAEELKRTRIATSRLRSEAAAVLAYEGRSLAGRLLIRSGQFQRAIDTLELESTELGPSAPRYFIDGLISTARGILACQQGRRDEAGLALSELVRWHGQLESASAQIQSSNEKFYARRATAVLDILTRVVRSFAASSPQTGRIFMQSAIQRDQDAAGARMDPPLLPLSIQELAGTYFLTVHDAPAAQSAFKAALLERPHNGYILNSLAKAQKIGGDASAAQITLQNALAAFHAADPDLPALLEARAASSPP